MNRPCAGYVSGAGFYTARNTSFIRLHTFWQQPARVHQGHPTTLNDTFRWYHPLRLSRLATGHCIGSNGDRTHISGVYSRFRNLIRFGLCSHVVTLRLSLCMWSECAPMMTGFPQSPTEPCGLLLFAYINIYPFAFCLGSNGYPLLFCHTAY